MILSFLPQEIRSALDHLNSRFLTEIRLREGQAVLVCYRGEYRYLGPFGITEKAESAVVCNHVGSILNQATERSVFAYTEQIKQSFITAEGGVRIGICGEYVVENGRVIAVKNPTSLNVRIPHEAAGCANQICSALFGSEPVRALIFSPPGFGKTTILRDAAKWLSANTGRNVLVFDQRYEISCRRSGCGGFDLGKGCDVILGGEKLSGFQNAIRAMKPDVILTDELYGDDFDAVAFAADCGISVVATSHICDKKALSDTGFRRFVELKGIGKQAVVYDKDFNIIGYCSTVGSAGDPAVGG